jgi:hypothetical protein
MTALGRSWRAISSRRGTARLAKKPYPTIRESHAFRELDVRIQWVRTMLGEAEI